MGKSFNQQLRDALDASHLGEGRLSTADHYRFKSALRSANMSGRQFESADDFARYLMKPRRFQR